MQLGDRQLNLKGRNRLAPKFKFNNGSFKPAALDNEFVFGWSYCPETKDSGLVSYSSLLDFFCELQLNLCARNRSTRLVRNSSSDGRSINGGLTKYGYTRTENQEQRKQA